MFNIFGSDKKKEEPKKEESQPQKQMDLGVTVNRVYCIIIILD